MGGIKAALFSALLWCTSAQLLLNAFSDGVRNLGVHFLYQQYGNNLPGHGAEALLSV
jgi:hypothetical protein